MFFTKIQLGDFVKSIKTNKDTPLFTSAAATPPTPSTTPINYLICQLNFPQFFSALCKLITTIDETQITEASRCGEILLRQYSPRLKDTKHDPTAPFYMIKDRFDLFISDILYPLLKILKERKRHKWQELPQKWGLWRIFATNEKMPMGSEISMNFKTGKNWLRM